MNPIRPLVLCVTLSMPLAPAFAQATPPVTVPTVVVGAAPAGATLDFDAVLEPVRQATVAAQVGGSVIALHVRAGDRVKKGQPLVRLDDREMRAASARSDAAVAQAEAELRNAQQVQARNRELQRSGFLSPAAVDTADNQVGAARAAVRQAQAARAQAGVAQGYAELAAPFDGVVLSTLVEAGDLALPGRALLTLYEPGALRAVVQVPASRAGAAQGATQVLVQLADGRGLAPLSRELLPAADPVSQTVTWRLVLPVEAAGLRPGQTARVVARAAPGEGSAPARPSVPVQALLRRGELSAVYVAQPQGFVLRAVRTGAVAGGRVDVLAGLAPGESVALDPVRAGLPGAKAAAK